MPSRNFGRSEFITQFRRELTLSSLPADAQQRARRAALEVFLNDMRYINPRFTYLLYLLTCFAAVSCLFFFIFHNVY